ncbi:UNVERIFIED_CONTAM: hypothetical protein GTU68_048075 [Idotea baltica]|nr:hypothetical protein [Idotea baltica]
MELDVVLLSRIQFAFTIIFHYIFPPFSIGLGALLVTYESLSLITRKPIYEKITRFWVKIFAANFSLGVATGIVMEFEFGTNWATYSRFVGDIFGSPLAAEGIFAFFLESGFLAILLFGWNKVSKGMHLFATVMVFVGSLMSAFWIIVANSWMHTPVAYEIVGEGVDRMAQITDFWEMVFNPSSMIRFLHAVVGAFLQGGFLVLSVSAYYLLKDKYVEFAQRSFTIALIFVTATSLLQPILGHTHAQVVAKYQPAKLAAFEGLYETEKGAPLYIMGITDPEDKKTHGIAIPKMLSFLAKNDLDAEIKGLNEFPRDEWPNVSLIFQTYHAMVALGMFFIALSLLSIFLLWRGKLFKQKWLMKLFVISVVFPILANQFGWISAEAGRQPWIVQGLLKTADAASKSVTGGMVLGSLIMFLILYSLLFWVWIYVLNKEIQHGPQEFFQDGPEAYKKRKDKLDVIDKTQKH